MEQNYFKITDHFESPKCTDDETLMLMMSIGIRPVAYVKEIGQFRIILPEDLMSLIHSKKLSGKFHLRFALNNFETNTLLSEETSLNINALDKKYIDKIRPILTYYLDSTDLEASYLPVLQPKTEFSIDNMYLTKNDHSLFLMHQTGNKLSYTFDDSKTVVATTNRAYRLSTKTYTIGKSLYTLSVQQKDIFFKPSLIFENAQLETPKRGFGSYFSSSQEANDSNEFYDDLIIKNSNGSSSYRLKGL